MLLNYLKTAIRNFKKSIFYSAINIFGLAFGFTCVIIIFLFIQDELKYDDYHEKGERIYRQMKMGASNRSPITPGVFYKYEQAGVPGIETLCMLRLSGYVLKVEENILADQRVLIADTNLFKLFSWDVVAGNPSEALKNVNQIILTSSSAKKYFGMQSPLGKEVLLHNSYSARVAAVIEDPSSHSHFNFDVIVPIHFMEEINPSALTNWGNSSFNYYCLLYPNADPGKVSQDIYKCWQKNAPEGEKGTSPVMLQALKDIHLHSDDVRWEIQEQGSITTVRILGISAALILALACINFINLSTAFGNQRRKEISLRKVVGSDKKAIVFQFLTETAICVLIALVFSFLIAELFLPWFSDMSGKNLELTTLLQVNILIPSVLFVIGIIILAGTYPSFILSAYQPNEIIGGRGAMNSKKRNSFGLREALVVLQFAISMGLLTGAFFVKKQLELLQTKDLGFKRENIIAIKNPWDEKMDSRFDSFKQKLSLIPGITATAGTHNVPGKYQNNYGFFNIKGSDRETQGSQAALIAVENNFFDILEAKIIEGEDFPERLSDRARDSLPYCIINKTLADVYRNMGFESLIGMKLNGFWDDIKDRTIIGVVDDMHFRSLHNKVHPAAFIVSKTEYPNYVLNMLVKTNSDNPEGIYASIEEAWKASTDEWPFQATFLEEKLDGLYQQERNMSRLSEVFTYMALLISLLGLLALTLFVLQSRLKEIGIRKMLGASGRQIFNMLSWSFLRLVFIANIIALPLMGWLMQKWLENFAYQISISWWVFGLAFLFSVLFTLMVVSYQTYKASKISPIKVLKYN